MQELESDEGVRGGGGGIVKRWKYPVDFRCSKFVDYGREFVSEVATNFRVHCLLNRVSLVPRSPPSLPLPQICARMFLILGRKQNARQAVVTYRRSGGR
jgi:hypothetical protein